MENDGVQRATGFRPKREQGVILPAHKQVDAVVVKIAQRPITMQHQQSHTNALEKELLYQQVRTEKDKVVK